MQFYRRDAKALHYILSKDVVNSNMLIPLLLMGPQDQFDSELATTSPFRSRSARYNK